MMILVIADHLRKERRHGLKFRGGTLIIVFSRGLVYLFS